MKEIRELIIRMAEGNPSWGYARIQGALKHLDHRVARSTIAKVTSPISSWMEQIARNLTDCEEGFLTGKRFLIIDRDAKYSPKFQSILGSSGVEILLTAYQAPNMNAYAERFVRSIKSECLDKMILLGRESLVRAVVEYAAHYHDERSHQGIGNVMISGTKAQGEGAVEARSYFRTLRDRGHFFYE